TTRSTHDLKATPHALQGTKRRQHLVCRLARGDGEARRQQRVGGLIDAGERKAQLVAAPCVSDTQRLSEAVSGDRLEPQYLAAPADAHHGASAGARGGDYLGCRSDVGVDNGGSARRQQLGKEPQFGGEIGFHGGVIVEMIAAEIGEGRSFQPYAVEAVLVETVRGGLQG